MKCQAVTIKSRLNIGQVFFAYKLHIFGVYDFYKGVGPFLEAIMRSLENMLDNSLYVTLQTTSVLAALASYPQPLIAHYLFDQRMLLQPNVKNLFKVSKNLFSENLKT